MSADAFARQFARSPYAVSFESAGKTFILVTLHVLYGKSPGDRIGELAAIAQWLAGWADEIAEWGHNLICLGDFNIDRQDDPLFQAFTSTGLASPPALDKVPRTIFDAPDKSHFYDQIAWFADDSKGPALSLAYERAGSFDFVPLWQQALTTTQLSWRIFRPLSTLGGVLRTSDVSEPQPPRQRRLQARRACSRGGPRAQAAAASPRDRAASTAERDRPVPLRRRLPGDALPPGDALAAERTRLLAQARPGIERLGRLDHRRRSRDELEGPPLRRRWRRGQLRATDRRAAPRLASRRLTGRSSGSSRFAGHLGARLAATYRRYLFRDATLQELPPRPRSSSTPPTSSRGRSGASQNRTWATTASARSRTRQSISRSQSPRPRAFPPVLSPVLLASRRASSSPIPARSPALRTTCTRRPYTTRVVLADGGVYDNLGLETVWKWFATVLVSDGGGQITDEPVRPGTTGRCRPSGCSTSSTIRCAACASAS